MCAAHNHLIAPCAQIFTQCQCLVCSQYFVEQNVGIWSQNCMNYLAGFAETYIFLLQSQKSSLCLKSANRFDQIHQEFWPRIIFSFGIHMKRLGSYFRGGQKHGSRQWLGWSSNTSSMGTELGSVFGSLQYLFTPTQEGPLVEGGQGVAISHAQHVTVFNEKAAACFCFIHLKFSAVMMCKVFWMGFPFLRSLIWMIITFQRLAVWFRSGELISIE